MKRHTYVYKEDKKQDFAEIEVRAEKPRPSNFEFLPHNPLWRLCAWIFYHCLAIPILGIYSLIAYHTKVVNKNRVIQATEGRGVFHLFESHDDR